MQRAEQTFRRWNPDTLGREGSHVEEIRGWILIRSLLKCIHYSKVTHCLWDGMASFKMNWLFRIRGRFLETELVLVKRPNFSRRSTCFGHNLAARKDILLFLMGFGAFKGDVLFLTVPRTVRTHCMILDMIWHFLETLELFVDSWGLQSYARL